MKLAFAAHHLPHPDGTAAGRQLWAVVDALRRAGHDATVWCWGPARPGLEAPEWCEHTPVPAPPRSIRGLPRTLVRPRAHVAGEWSPAPDVLPVADGRDSAPALPGGRAGAVVIHHSVWIDAAATGAWSPGLLQELRSERRAVSGSSASAALSGRVCAAVHTDRLVTPTVPLPPQLLPVVEQPVAAVLADWAWRPNQKALRWLLRIWPSVRRRVAGAELIVAGRNAPRDPRIAGVRMTGEVSDPAEVLSQAGLFVFPCPPSSGPKMKVLDAVLRGVPVLTTVWGTEGLTCDGVTTADQRRGRFTDALVRLLQDPAARARSASQANAAALPVHAPDAAASSWLELAAGLLHPARAAATGDQEV